MHTESHPHLERGENKLRTFKGCVRKILLRSTELFHFCHSIEPGPLVKDEISATPKWKPAPLLSLHIGGKYPPQSRFKRSRFKKVPKRTKKKYQKVPKRTKKYQEEPKTTEKNQKGAAPLSSLHIGEVHNMYYISSSVKR